LRLHLSCLSGEWIKDHAALGRHQPHKVLHQVERLDGRMLGAEPIVGVGLRGVEEAGGRAFVAMGSIFGVPTARFVVP
jgi:hypothetical protein